MNLNRISSQIYGLGVALLLTGCSITKVIAPTVSVADTDVTKHMETLAIIDLIKDCNLYPEKRFSIEDFLRFDIDYQDCSYQSLQLFENVAANDTSLASFFIELRKDKEDEILSKISTLSLPDLIDYYKGHPSEQNFISPFIENALYPVIDKEDYSFVRYIHEITENTRFSEHVDAVWRERRNELIPVINESIKEYCITENQIVDYLHGLCMNELYSTINGNFEQIIEKSINAIENSSVDLLLVEIKNGSIYDNVSNIVHQTISKHYVDSCVVAYLAPCLSQINSQRTEFIRSTVLRDSILYTGVQLPNLSDYYAEFIVPNKYLDALEKMKDSKRRNRNTLSIISTLAGFVTGIGPVANALLDGSDILYSIYSTSEESSQLSGYLSGFSDELYRAEIDYVTSCCDYMYSKFAAIIRGSQINMKKYVLENL